MENKNKTYIWKPDAVQPGDNEQFSDTKVEDCCSRVVVQQLCGKMTTIILMMILTMRPGTWKIRRENNRRCHPRKRESTWIWDTVLFDHNIIFLSEQDITASLIFSLTWRSRPNFCGSSTLETRQGLHPLLAPKFPLEEQVDKRFDLEDLM